MAGSVADTKVTAGVEMRTSTPKLKRLPVPDLAATVDKWLRSLEPFVLGAPENGKEDIATALRKRGDSYKASSNGEALRVLQDRLIDLDKRSPYNWLDDNIWAKKAYLESREPLLINSNWWLALFDDNTTPRRVEENRSSHPHSGFTLWQIRRASWLVYRLVDFKRRLEKQELYAGTTRAGIWYQHAFSRVFNVCRIPHTGCDILTDAPPDSSSARRRIFVMVRDCFYSVEVIRENGDLLSAHEIEKLLRKIICDVEQRVADLASPVGVLTAADRDSWAQNLQHLLSLSPRNHEIYTIIKESLFALSLDAHSYDDRIHSLNDEIILNDARSDDEIERDSHLHNARGGLNARNRWFDKGLTLIVENNTRASAMGEHAPVDALVPSIACEYGIVEPVNSNTFPSLDPEVDGWHNEGELPGWERMEWVVDSCIREACLNAESSAKRVIADSDNSLLWFDDYGADWIKDTLKLSPDAYIQMALQLAWYRTRHCFTAVYETALTRLFQHGRTETIRSFTTESRAFVLSMGDHAISDVTRYGLLSRAVHTHVALTRAAATGKGIDRHLLGLEYVQEPSDPVHPIFQDALYKISTEWKLSTSGLSAGHVFKGTGFGAPYPDGYGINYLAGPDIIKFGIESKYSCPKTSTPRFKSVLTSSLLDMKRISLCALEHSSARL